MDISYAVQNAGFILFLSMSRSARQPELLSYSVAITRPLTVTLHNCSHSLPLIHSASPVFHKLIPPTSFHSYSAHALQSTLSPDAGVIVKILSVAWSPHSQVSFKVQRYQYIILLKKEAQWIHNAQGKITNYNLSLRYFANCTNVTTSPLRPPNNTVELS